MHGPRIRWSQDRARNVISEKEYYECCCILFSELNLAKDPLLKMMQLLFGNGVVVIEEDSYASHSIHPCSSRGILLYVRRQGPHHSCSKCSKTSERRLIPNGFYDGNEVNSLLMITQNACMHTIVENSEDLLHASDATRCCCCCCF